MAEFRSEELARSHNTWNFPCNGTTVQWDAENMIDGFDKLNKLTFFLRKIYPFRRPLSFVYRKYYYVKSNYFAPKPDRENAVIC